MRAIRRIVATVLFVSFAPSARLLAQSRVTSPTEQFGHEIGADYVLPDYTQFMAYFQKLASESDRMVLDTIGNTAEGRPQLMAIITSPENQRNLEHYREISRRLALASGLTEDEAHRLAAEGKAVVWIDGGLHATEVLGAQQLMETVYQLVSAERSRDAPLPRRRDHPGRAREPGRHGAGVGLVHAEPGSHEALDRRDPAALPEVRRPRQQPRLLHVHAAGDREHEPDHVPGVVPADRVQPPPDGPGRHGDVRAAVPRSVQLQLRSARARWASTWSARPCTTRFAAESKPGVTMRSGASYSTWWNGGLRTTAYFHNMIGLLTETIGNPTPHPDPVRARDGSCRAATCRSRSRRSRGTSASRSTTR